MAEILDTVLLLALPASGKSEVRKYLAGMSPEVCKRDFHMGETVQLDDFPYVHMMRQLDVALGALGKPSVFFHAGDRPFKDPRDWGTLIHLVNEDHADLIAKKSKKPESAAQWLLKRFDAARKKVGAPAVFVALDKATQDAVCDKLEKEAQALLTDKLGNYPTSLKGKTLVIEFARGGAQGSAMPLSPPFGYAYSIGELSPKILSKACILYIWVTPEESRRKNDARANPDDPGSILHHGVPIEVMLKDYGCDDMAHLIERSDQPDTVRIEAHGKTYHLPVARFDNRTDKTSFVRNDRKDWKPAEIQALHDGLKGALGRLAKA
ncbi:MAG: hypothetical protein HY903_09305 [Deltaproteobacteria bacterium]|nr:hypothetical protein [Deltaproteobacteria bacterium]